MHTHTQACRSYVRDVAFAFCQSLDDIAECGQTFVDHLRLSQRLTRGTGLAHLNTQGNNNVSDTRARHSCRTIAHSTISEPARSTRNSLPFFTACVAILRWPIVMMNTLWLRDESWKHGQRTPMSDHTTATAGKAAQPPH